MSQMEMVLRFCGAVLGGYLLGSFPSGVLVGKVLGGGKDPRSAGSGKTGATNVLRTMGPGPAALVVVLDLGKGFASVMLARYALFPGALPQNTHWIAPYQTSFQSIGEALAAISALLGHNYPVFIGFRGGRGVLTGAGAILAMSPLAWLCGFVCAAIPIAMTRYVSLGSILGALGCPIAAFALMLTWHEALPHVLFMAVGGAIVIVSHKDNIERLLAGTERKLGERVKVSA